MTNYNTNNQLLTYDDLLNENNRLQAVIINLQKEKEELRLTISELRLYKDDIEKFSQKATVYDPKRMDTTGASYEQLKLKYIDLTKKLEQIEQEKNKEIDKLWDETIIPLQNQVKDKNIQLDTAYNIDRHNKDMIKNLEKVIDNLNMTIQFAAGYISSTPQFKDQHPMNVLKWLRGIQ